MIRALFLGGPLHGEARNVHAAVLPIAVRPEPSDTVAAIDGDAADDVRPPLVEYTPSRLAFPAIGKAATIFAPVGWTQAQREEALLAHILAGDPR